MARFCARVRTLAPSLAIAMRDVYAAPACASWPPRSTLQSPSNPRSPIMVPTIARQLLPITAAERCSSPSTSRPARRRGLRSIRHRMAGRRPRLPPPALGAGRRIRRGLFLRRERPCRRGQVAAPRPRPRRPDADLEPGLLSLLGGQAARARGASKVFVGTPVYNVFLRALGAQIGPGALVASRDVPVVGDLLRVGPGAVVGRRAILLGVKAVGNRLHFGRIDIGAGGYVGEASVLDIDTSIGDFGQLGHASSLASGQAVPAGKHFHGSPAEETTTNFRRADDILCPRARRVISSLVSLTVAALLAGAFEAASVAFGAALVEPEAVGASSSFLGAAAAVLAPSLLVSLGLYFGTLAIGLVAVAVVPRLANLALQPGRLYRLYGFHYAMQRLVEDASNSRMFNLLFGDSVFIGRYLRWVGWRIRGRRETGSNFGSNQKQDNPFLCTVGAGTLASDGLYFVNVSLSSGAFRLGECRVGADNYLGNDIQFLAGSRVGDNCLIATKTMMPIDGPMRENVGLLGSPAFEIPRSVARDVALVAALSEAERRERLAAKTRHNLVTMALLLASHWSVEFVTIYALALAAAVWGGENFPAMTAAFGAALVADLAILTFVDRASFGFRRMTPLIATVYDPAFWAVERHWKLSENELETMFAGTPFSPFFLRLLGVKVGRRVFNDGCGMSERTLVESAMASTSTRAATCNRTRSKKACSSRTSSASAQA